MSGPLGLMKGLWSSPIGGCRAHAFYAGTRCLQNPPLAMINLLIQYSNGCGMDIGVKGEGKEARIVGVRGRAVDRVNKGRLGPKGITCAPCHTSDAADREQVCMVG
jgi:hypothetical protein